MTCRGCGHVYPISNGIPNMVSPAQYIGHFSLLIAAPGRARDRSMSYICIFPRTSGPCAMLYYMMNARIVTIHTMMLRSDRPKW